MRFIDLKIRTKLMWTFGVLIFIGFLISAYSVATLLFFKRDIDSFSKEFLPQLELSTRISNESQLVAFNMEGYYLTGKADNYRLAKAALDSLKNTLNEGELLLSKAKNLSKLEQNLSEVKILIPQYEQVIVMAFKTFQDINILQSKSKQNAGIVVRTVITGKKAKKNSVTPVGQPLADNGSVLAKIAEKTAKLQELREKDAIISGKLKQNSDDLRTSAIAYTEEVAHGFDKSVNFSVIIQILFVLITLSLSVFIGIYVSRIITRPLIKGIAFAQKIAKGDLTAEIDITQNDEMGVLANNLQTMSMKIREIISHVASISENLASASLELSATSQLVSQGASEQASSAEEVSAAIEQMAANIQQNKENAKQTEKIAVKAENDIYHGSVQVVQTVDAMREIANKISIIGDIAFQTNILALNAAVEAARAGEHGRGFGVVAAEVGKLAERSKVSASEIDQLTKTSVSNAEEAGKLMKEIVPDIQKTSQLIHEMSAANIEQSSGADQINIAIQQLNMVTQQNAATSEELATNADQLSGQAEQLRELISFFRLNNETNSKRLIKIPKQNNQTTDFEKPKAKHGVVIDLDLPDVSDDEFERF
jgi:methyl-accepting chemotaxis protein